MANAFTGGTATVDAGTNPGFVVDGDLTSRWLASTAPPHWWKYDFGAGNTKKITKYRMDNTFGGGNGARDWTFEGSNNDTAWTTLDTRTGITATGWRGWYDIASPAEYRYYKINITATNDAGFVYIWEAEGNITLPSGFFAFF